MLILDFEASSLSRKSYPIEVAWGTAEHIQSFLINPGEVKHWTEWNKESEQIHGLSLDYICKHGEPAEKVAKQMLEDLEDKMVYVDGGHYDVFWKDRLLELLGIDTDRVQFYDIFKYWGALFKENNIRNAKQHIINIRMDLEQSMQIQHRAHADVLWLHTLNERIHEFIASRS